MISDNSKIISDDINKSNIRMFKMFNINIYGENFNKITNLLVQDK